MTAAVLTAMAVLAAGGVVLWLPAVSRALDDLPWWVAAGLPSVALGAVALLAAVAAGDVSGPPVDAAAVLAVVVATLAGGTVATAVLRGAEQSGVTGVSYPTETLEPGEPPQELRGGLWIGALERAAVAVCLLVGQPAGLALVIAVKGLGRYPELRAPGAAERFIIGTFASFLWAAAAAGTALLLR